ncbi:DUF4249 domain-containing protein [Roseivirga sp. BDSF3-8]|uniref:DUF4249 domain-containing protein n=1 Tax=Roseivirga sp. BDSF3-8 TaxID=3241598 RepID=UPI0035320B8B
MRRRLSLRLSTYLILFIPALITWGCEDVVDIDLDQGETLLVVDGNVYDNEGPYTVRLNLTAPYFANAPLPAAEGAKVTITDNEGTSDRLTETDPGVYVTDSLQGVPGRTYTLTVDYAGETYTAVSLLRAAPQIDSVYYTFEEEQAFQDAGYFLYYYGPELPGQGDHYRLKVYRNGEQLTDPDDLIFFPDRLVNGNYLFDLQINSDPFEEQDEFSLDLLSITESHYFYLLELQEQTNNGGLFSDPPANIRTNVVNTNPDGPAAVGWFTAAGINSIEGSIEGNEGVVYP